MNDEALNDDADADDFFDDLKVEDDNDNEENPVQAKAPYHVYTARSGQYVRIPEIYTHDLGVLASTKAEFGYQMDLCALSMDNIDQIEEEISLVGAGLGGGFDHTSKLKVIKYNNAMKTKDSDKWEISVEEENKQMKNYKVWVSVKMQNVPKKAKIQTSKRVTKNKSNVLFILREFFVAMRKLTGSIVMDHQLIIQLQVM